MKRPSYWYSNSEEALECVCSQCSRETGWLEDPDIETPACAIRIIEDEECLRDDGSCPRFVSKRRRQEAERKRREEKELALYERRMRGDWS